MKNIIGLKEFRENLPKYERKIAKGESFVVMKRSKPIFKATPIDEGAWETVVDFTQFKNGGVPVSDVVKALEELD